MAENVTINELANKYEGRLWVVLYNYKVHGYLLQSSLVLFLRYYICEVAILMYMYIRVPKLST